MGIVIAGSGGTFSGLIELNQVGRVTIAFEVMIAQSLARDKCRATRSEVKRRFDICADIFKQLRGDLHWGIDRALNFLPTYLRAELDGVSWQPDKRSMWMPFDGAI